MFLLKSLRVKSVLAALIPMAVVLTIVATVGLSALESTARDTATQRDSELARISAARLSDGLQEQAAVLQGIATEIGGRPLAPAALGTALEADPPPLFVFDAGVVIYDRGGVAIWSDAPDSPREGTRLPDDRIADEIGRTLRPAFSNILHDPISGEDVIVVAVPILGADGAMEGTLAGMSTLRFSLLGALFTEVLELKAGRSGFAYLVDGNGRAIHHRDLISLRHGPDRLAAGG